MIRVTAGQYKNVQLKVPDSARPFTDRTRISVFDTLREYLFESSIADLYAGSGVTGIEALSRGAKSCVFVESNAKASKIIEVNLQKLNPPCVAAQVITMSAETFIKKAKEAYDIVFVDPPFDKSQSIKLDLISHIVNSGGLLIAKLPSKRSQSIQINDFDLILSKRYGASMVVFYRKKV